MNQLPNNEVMYMKAKTLKKPSHEKKAAARTIRGPKTQDEIKKELREQRALDTDNSAVEDYLVPNSRHFGF